MRLNGAEEGCLILRDYLRIFFVETTRKTADRLDMRILICGNRSSGTSLRVFG